MAFIATSISDVFHACMHSSSTRTTLRCLFSLFCFAIALIDGKKHVCKLLTMILPVPGVWVYDTVATNTYSVLRRSGRRKGVPEVYSFFLSKCEMRFSAEYTPELMFPVHSSNPKSMFPLIQSVFCRVAFLISEGNERPRSNGTCA